MKTSEEIQYGKYQWDRCSVPLIVLTWPRWAGKSFTMLRLIELIDELSLVPQISCREMRADDNSKLLKFVNERDFHQLKNRMLVHTSRYWILLEDLNNTIQEWKIPILTLGWKEICKLQKNWFKDNLLIVNITYPLENGKLSQDTISDILKNRFWNRNWNQQEKEVNLDLLMKYMKLFFNNPNFTRRFTYTFESKNCSDEIIDHMSFIIKQIILPIT